ncbi:MAG: hypothetical protein A2X46_16165 [Lentisphaerae bacterium GWF2_57_35]|nr:MAG: hypothetical protein A2X46_16165 [Lentisphaerae bacterium GWF2_57_35]
MFAFLTMSVCVQAEVMLQWFETEWEEMYRRMPEVSTIGYDYIWTPPPTKGPTGLGTKWGNVGYSLYDRFDLGDIPQRGSWATRYGTRGDLRNMVNAAHRLDVKILPDIIMNHNGNGPDFRSYPGMVPEDFHVQWAQGYCNSLNYKRGPRMDQWTPNEGYGGTMWQELCNLIDIRTEDHPNNSSELRNRFTGGNNTPGWNFVGGTSYLRHKGQYDKYPYYAVDTNTYKAETAPEMLWRWISWLGNSVDYDGLRLDAGKHVNFEFFGWKGNGFLHEAQWSFNTRRGYSDPNEHEADELYKNYLVRNDALIFAEILSYQSELGYWFGGDMSSGPSALTRNPMRFLDYPLKQKLYDAFSNGNLASLTAGGGGIHPELGIMYAWGHDEAGPNKVNLAYAYILTHVGFPMVYFTGNNITWADNNTKTWMRPGYDSQALADQYGDIANLVWVHQQFARGNEYDRWSENDFFSYERYDDVNGNGSPDAGEGLLLVALNDSGWDQTRTVACSFQNGTVLKDFTGHNFDEVTVSGGQAVIRVPGNSGQGWVCYAPKMADPVRINVKQDGSTSPTMTWIVPGGIHAGVKTQQITRVTSTNVTVDVSFNPAGGAVDAVMLKWGNGRTRLTPTNVWVTGQTNLSVVAGFYEKCDQINSTNWYMNVQITETNLVEGLNVIKARAFNQRDAGLPALFNTAAKVVYIDRRGPELSIAHPAEGATIRGAGVMLITNIDYLAYGITVSVDGGAPQSADQTIKGLWKFNLDSLSAGTHTALVTATEADWNSPRQVINTSSYARVFNVVGNAQSIELNHADNTQKELPFFKTAVTTPGTPSSVRLFWNGYELPFNDGLYTNTFNGEIVYRDFSGAITDRLWGAYVNGANFFEAERVDGGVTSRVSRRVVLNLYGINAIDSDGDTIPDNVEMPFIDSDGAPGPDASWPGDSNKNFIPEWGETWTRLNPYNHSTFYSGQWDDNNDFDGDGFSNGQEVQAGYAEANIYLYNIYDRNSKPSSSPTTNKASVAYYTPNPAQQGQTLAITFSPNDGPLKGISPVYLHVGHSKKTFGTWQQVTGLLMTANSTNWVLNYPVPTNATSVDFCFRDSTSASWDSNNGSDWQANVAGVSNTSFVIDGEFDGANGGDAYTVFPDAMKLLTAVNGSKLYVATWSTEANDVMIYVTDELGDAKNAPWAKAGQVFFDVNTKPYLAAESTLKMGYLNNVAGAITNGTRSPANKNALEATFDLIEAFGHIPEAIYVASVAYETGDAGTVQSQGPYSWDSGNNIEIMEFQRVPIASIRDDDLDGYFDGGKPQMWTAVNANTNDANYGLRRMFLDELASDYQELTVILQPNANGTVSDVELFSNINRRDFAVMPGDEDPDTVNASSATTYYRAYPMTSIGGGQYSYTIRVNKCGAYRVNARYRVNGGDYVYYTDGGLRRDCAVVVSPKKALNQIMYELNPMIAEARDDTFFGRSTFQDMYQVNTDRQDAISTNHFKNMNMNMIWLQPIHPIGGDGRQTDPSTGLAYDPGSPYAVQDYWKVNSTLGDPAMETNSIAEFTDFVRAMDDNGVGVMLDGTFNHSAWDAQIGQIGVDMGISTNPNDLIRVVRPQWFARKDNYGQQATYYQSGGNNDIATAPDRIDFGKWTDAAELYFGVYDCLVQQPPSDTNNAWSSRWYHRYLLEEDRFEGFPTNGYTREVWEFFAQYPLYWLEKTGHPVGTPQGQSYKGIDGLRCDFAQGLPSLFWEYAINKTRSMKWDFLFMAESLDGFRDVGGTKRHGVGYRSSRHFDILNENMVFYWRDKFFDYLGYEGNNPQPKTAPTWQAFDDRRNAFDVSPILLNLTSHDEIYPSDNQWRLIYAYAILASMDGVPMMIYGQEAGAQNDAATYPGAEAKNNFGRYEINFSKAIPNFKRYNYMTNIWNGMNTGWKLPMMQTYQRLNWARVNSPALRSQQNYFLALTNTSAYDPDIFGVAKFQAPGVSAASQDVVFVFVNNNFVESASRWATYKLDAAIGGQNWFGIQPGNSYNLVDLAAANPTNYVWGSDRTGADLIANGITVGLTGDAYAGQQAQYLRLIDRTAGITPTNRVDYYGWNRDGDGLPAWWKDLYGLASGDGPGGDKDNDGMSNYDEYIAGTNPNSIDDVLEVSIDPSGSGINIDWSSKTNINYYVERTDRLLPQPVWQSIYFGTALGNSDGVVDNSTAQNTNLFYRVRVKP